LCNWPQNT